MIPIGTHHTSTASGTIWKAVTCDGCGAARETPVDDLRQLSPHPRMVAPRSLIGSGRYGVVGEIIDGVGNRRTCMIDSAWRQVAG